MRQIRGKTIFYILSILKKFLSHIVLYYGFPLLLVVGFFNIKPSLWLNDAKECFEMVFFAESNALNTKTLLLGDSVCNQFFEDFKDDNTYCYCYNQSHEVPGNYLFLKMFLENNSKIDNVVLIINPITLASSLNQKFTNNYFVKPFRDHLKDLDEIDFQYIKQTYPTERILKYKFSNFELPNVIDLRLDNSIEKLEVSNRNLKYLAKLDSLCKINNISFKVVSPPLPLSSKQQIEKFTASSKQVLPGYFESIFYYDSMQSSDGIHHKNPKSFADKNAEHLKSLTN